MALTAEELAKYFGGNSQETNPGNPFNGDGVNPIFFGGFGKKDPGPDFKMDGLNINEKWAKNNPDRAQGKLIEAQWLDFLNRYAPIEQDLMNRLKDFDFTEEARQAGSTVAGSFDQQMAGMDRNMSRFGLSANTGQREAAQDQLELNRAMGVAGAENLTRRGMRDRNLELMNIMAGHGRGIASNALSGMGQAGALAAQRKQIGDQAEKANTQSMIGGAASGAMYGFASGGGPVGAVVGALIGGILGGI